MSSDALLQWNSPLPCLPKGVLTAADQDNEMHVKTWWDCYVKYNDMPVTFFDFGMSQNTRAWCETKGSIIPFALPNGFAITQETDLELNHRLATFSKKQLMRRNIWFHQPFALFKTPYQYSIWINLTSLVVKTLDPLFNFSHYGDGFAITYEPADFILSCRQKGLLAQGEHAYKTNVIAFMRHSPIIDLWATICKEKHQTAFSEHLLLSQILKDNQLKIFIFSSFYNWASADGDNPFATIIHHDHQEQKAMALQYISPTNI